MAKTKFDEPEPEVKPKAVPVPPPAPPKAVPAFVVPEGKILVDKKMFGKLAMAVVTGKVTPITSGTGAMMNIARMVSGNPDINHVEATAVWDKIKADFYAEV